LRKEGGVSLFLLGRGGKPVSFTAIQKHWGGEGSLSGAPAGRVGGGTFLYSFHTSAFYGQRKILSSLRFASCVIRGRKTLPDPQETVSRCDHISRGRDGFSSSL